MKKISRTSIDLKLHFTSFPIQRSDYSQTLLERGSLLFLQRLSSAPTPDPVAGIRGPGTHSGLTFPTDVADFFCRIGPIRRCRTKHVIYSLLPGQRPPHHPYFLLQVISSGKEYSARLNEFSQGNITIVGWMCLGFNKWDPV